MDYAEVKVTCCRKISWTAPDADATSEAHLPISPLALTALTRYWKCPVKTSIRWQAPTALRDAGNWPENWCLIGPHRCREPGRLAGLALLLSPFPHSVSPECQTSTEQANGKGGVCHSPTSDGFICHIGFFFVVDSEGGDFIKVRSDDSRDVVVRHEKTK